MRKCGVRIVRHSSLGACAKSDVQARIAMKRLTVLLAVPILALPQPARIMSPDMEKQYRETLEQALRTVTPLPPRGCIAGDYKD